MTAMVAAAIALAVGIAVAAVPCASPAAPAAGRAGSRPILFFQKGSSIDKVRLTPRHRPKRVVDAGNGPLAIAAGQGFVFWITLGNGSSGAYQASIMRATVRGKGVRKIASGLPITTALVASGGYLYWPGEDGIGRVALDGSHLNPDYVPLPEEYGGGVADGLTAEGRYLYFSRCQDGTVGRVDLTTRSVRQRLIDLPGRQCPQALAAARGRVYWAELGGFGFADGRIGSANLDGSDLEPATFSISSADGPFELAAGGSTIFWSYGGSAGSPEYVGRADLGGRLLSSTFVSGGSALALLPGGEG